MSKKGNNTVEILAGLLAGAAAGVFLGMLYAPEEGRKTRKKIKSKANNLKDQAVDQYGKVSELTKEQYVDVSGKIKHQYGNISSQVKYTADKLVSSVKEGYDKYKDRAIAKTTEVVQDIEHELDGMKS
jgi:gas vesicle protein